MNAGLFKLPAKVLGDILKLPEGHAITDIDSRLDWDGQRVLVLRIEGPGLPEIADGQPMREGYLNYRRVEPRETEFSGFEMI